MKNKICVTTKEPLSIVLFLLFCSGLGIIIYAGILLWLLQEYIFASSVFGGTILCYFTTFKITYHKRLTEN